MFDAGGMDNADFGLVRSFGIDNGELDGFRPQECFVLGYELALFADLLDDERLLYCQIDRLAHIDNRERIERFCNKAGRACVCTYHPNDQSESWMTVTILPANRPNVLDG